MSIQKRNHETFGNLLSKASDVDVEKIENAYMMLSYVPNPGLKAAHMDDRPIRAIFGGNRSGKTVWGVNEVGMWAFRMHPYLDWVNDIEPPINIRICCTSFAQGIKGVILPTIREWWPKGAWDYKSEGNLIEIWESQDTDKVLMATVELMSYDQDLDKFGGQSKHLIWCDEEPPFGIWQENMMRLLDTDGYMLLTMTPIHGMTWVYEDIYLSDDIEHIGTYNARTLDNPHLSEKAITKIRQLIHSEDDEAVRLYGEFIPTSHFIYPMWNPTIHVVDPLDVWKDPERPGQLPDDWMVVLGIDPHDRTPHGVIFCGINREGDVYIFDEISEHCLISELAQLIKKKLRGRIPAYSMIDSSANTESSIAGISMIQEFSRPGNDIHVLPTKKGRDSVLEGIQRVRDYLVYEKDESGKIIKRPKLYVFKNCKHLIREFKLYVWEDWKGTNRQRKDPKEAPLKKDDHLLDSLRYVLMTRPIYRHPSLTKKLYEGLQQNMPGTKIPRPTKEQLHRGNKFTGC